ncbi:MAG: Adenosine deaminase [Jatrophihabitantaceae bacterium]|nr:Adenosine deaminase [Jatrophihabitantaceae bacterium]
MCRVERIDHGYTATAEPDLVRRFADEGIALTMCPLSNLRLRIVDDLAVYPLPMLLDAGVLVTLNSDDPPYFGGYLNANYERSAGASHSPARRSLRSPATASPGRSPQPGTSRPAWPQSTRTSRARRIPERRCQVGLAPAEIDRCHSAS